MCARLKWQQQDSEDAVRTIKAFVMIATAVGSNTFAVDFESPPEESASASLPAELITGPDFHVIEPVQSDGLMHHYVLVSRFGDFGAYGMTALAVRVREIAALTKLSNTTDVDVVVKTVSRRVQGDVKTITQVAGNPIKTVVGIPNGVSHLFHGYKAQATEISEHVQQQSQSHASSNGPRDLKADATRYAARYLGVSAAERRYYQQLGVDPYTNNEVLRRTVHHLAKVDATVNLGMHFVGIPGVPYLGDVRRAMDAIYNEDPAVLRARQRSTLAGYGLNAGEIRRFENTFLLSPTRQSLLAEYAKSLNGVAGRDELFRHAMSVTSDDEMAVFLQSAGLLASLHAHRPVVRIVSGLRLPAAQFADGGIVVLGAFDSVYWTEDVATDEAALHTLLPTGLNHLELWTSGTLSPRARSELAARGWDVHDYAAETLAK
jgi:hypothetical protein